MHGLLFSRRTFPYVLVRLLRPWMKTLASDVPFPLAHTCRAGKCAESHVLGAMG
ncbi:hypothetical protein STXM2123_118 [Streptomyces sp. F-3]|nr:hypothetical protein STXM2123_118 [Streptomyces sp. F-3]